MDPFSLSGWSRHPLSIGFCGAPESRDTQTDIDAHGSEERWDRDKSTLFTIDYASFSWVCGRSARGGLPTANFQSPLSTSISQPDGGDDEVYSFEIYHR